jgi:ATP-dependent Clp protease ATP-binding subunit ClpA
VVRAHFRPEFLNRLDEIILFLKRVIQKELQDPLAEKILLGDILDGSTVKITSGSDRLNFRSKPSVVKADKAEAA